MQGNSGFIWQQFTVNLLQKKERDGNREELRERERER
jgi:hypothetical protein